ncbi:MAG: thioredoxin-disulfide reductase [Clostridia bacterium]|nr:thioredoxin-disulfide reductase [Clostridia bacterium]
MQQKTYDVVIIGGGPAGYTAALYCVRAGFVTLLLEKFSAGGQMIQTQQIDNYPGFFEGIDGFTLGDNMKKCAERFGATTVQQEVISVDLKSKIKTIKTASEQYFAKAVILATGAEHRKLGLENEDELSGRGVSYCASCDGMFYKNKTVAVVGGGNTAAAEALVLSRVCNKVYLIHRKSTMRATKIYYEQLSKSENVVFKWNCEVKKLISDNKLKEIKIVNNKTNESENLQVDGLFISVGMIPTTNLYKGQINSDEWGYVIADETTKTNIPGVFAVGDLRTKPLRQIVTATADGAVAAHYVEKYLTTTFKDK